LPGVEVTRDFLLLEFDIRSCDLVPPVSAEELNLYIDFLRAFPGEAGTQRARWQDYESIRAGSKTGALPAWYAFYDDAIGHSLLALPDLKGEKEMQYLQGLQTGAAPEQASPAGLVADYKTLAFFVSTFEDKALLRYFDVMEAGHPDISGAAQLDEALQLLRESDEPVPVAAAADWQEAVIAAAQAHSVKKTAAALRAYYAEYRLRLDAGLSFTGDADPLVLDLLRDKIAVYKKNILRGRRRLDEPCDFNY
jgi:hypothetical protein